MDVSAGASHTVALYDDGTVRAIGNNNFGKCNVSNWTDIIAVAAGGFHTVGLKADGRVVCAGCERGEINDVGQCDTNEWRDVVAIAANYTQTIGLKRDGTVLGAGSGVESCVDKYSDIVAISAGRFTTVLLKSDGTVVVLEGAWSHDTEMAEQWKNVASISAGGDGVIALQNNGSFLFAGNFENIDAFSSWKNLSKISAGENSVLGLKSDGTVVANGSNYCGNCDVSGWCNIVAISAGSSHAIGLTEEGKVVSTKYIGDEENYDGKCEVEILNNYALGILEEVSNEEVSIPLISFVEPADNFTVGYDENPKLILKGNTYRVFFVKEGAIVKTEFYEIRDELGNGYGYFVVKNENSIITFVFDSLIVSASLDQFNRLKEFLQSSFPNKDVEQTNYYNSILKISSRLYSSELGEIANNYLRDFPIDILLGKESLLQFESMLAHCALEGNWEFSYPFPFASAQKFLASDELERCHFFETYFDGGSDLVIVVNDKRIFTAFESEFLNFVDFLLNEYKEEIHNNLAKNCSLIPNDENASVEDLLEALTIIKTPTEKYVAYILLLKALDRYAVLYWKRNGVEIENLENLDLSNCVALYINSQLTNKDDIITKGTFVKLLMQLDKFSSNNYLICLKEFEDLVILAEKKNKRSKFKLRYLNNSTEEKQITMTDVDLMSGVEFEIFIADLFKKMGYKATITKASGDQGVDIIAERDGVKIAIQAKRYAGAVSNSAVQEAVAGKKYYSCDKTLVVTNSIFTSSAIDLAKANDVLLWDRAVLNEKL